MNIKIRKETIEPMFKICKSLRDGNFDVEQLEKVLKHSDYQVEMDRYTHAGGPSGGFTYDEFIDFFTNIYTLKFDGLENTRMKQRYHAFKEFMDNIEEYESKVDKLELITEELVVKAISKAKSGLPETVEFEEMDVIFSIGMGPSGGWFYDGKYTHYDIVQFLKDFDKDNLYDVLAHEFHHIGSKKHYATLDMSKITLEDYFYLFLSGEGLAVKYCNNYQGVLTKNTCDGKANASVTHKDRDYFISEFDNVYQEFLKDIKSIRSGEIASFADMSARISGYWMSLKTKYASADEPNDMAQSLNYFLGAEIWGLIHDVHGLDRVYEIIDGKTNFVDSYNEALKAIDRSDLEIEIPSVA